MASTSWKGGERIPPWSLQKEHGSTDTLILAQWDPCQASSIPNDKAIYLYYLKPLSLSCSVPVALGNEYSCLCIMMSLSWRSPLLP